ncbi:S8 family serine peptidase [Paenactinomyces guangxiensis]|uniref:S8 family serine peptidase n=1 Tax=Paenactinomyces guangxiensis TaxID=1490290 RepID=A0A7W1WNR2_9BACL|nr:S8 family serine peptidase [Paenactinomyces guangxiensis]MBA4493196.1 S8 family serine peptidase [Paenactinomyces guangxiensis]MBH8589954.1 S8 family serine peptidase [Paenactinomyces guangxiensis]
MRAIRVLSIILAVLFSFASIAVAETPSKSKKTSLPVSEKEITPIHKVKGSKWLSNLHHHLAKSDKTDKIPVIITYKTLNQSVNLQSAKKHIETFAPRHVYKNIPAMSATLTKAQIEELSKSTDVVQIEYDEPVKAFSQTANTWYGTQKARTDFGVTGDRDGQPSSYSKDDIVIAVIDTGIDASHVDLDGGKVIGWKDYVNNRSAPYDDQGHGTHVAGIAAGSGDGNSAYTGVAPGAALVGVKVLDQNGSGSMSDVTAGIDWAISNKDVYGIKVINMSLGTTGSSDGTDATSQAANRASDAGIVVAVAAGNSGPARKTIGSPGAADKALTVGAMADPGEKGFNLASFSSRGTTADGRIKPDIAAPGFNITAAQANSNNGYVTYSGTSMATPFTAGTVALMLDANPSLTPEQVKSTLASTAIDFGPTGKDIDYGSGNMRGYEAVKTAGNFSGTGPSLPNHLFAQGSINTSGYKDEWTFQVDSTQAPIAVTFIMPDWTGSWFSSSPDFDIYLYDPSGNQVGKSEGTKRQETITFSPTQTGQYKLRAYSYSGTGAYFFDISSFASELTQVANDQR